MKVKDFIEELKKLDQEKNIWLMYDPPFSVSEPEVEHLVGDNTDFARMFSDRDVKEGDYAIIAC